MTDAPDKPTPRHTAPALPDEEDGAYTLASRDLDFLATDDLRAVRLQLELLKPEIYLRRQSVQSTIPVFGSARLLPPQVAAAKLTALEESGTAGQAEITRARRRVANAHYYTEAEAFSRLVAQRLQQNDGEDFVIVTGGGPGIMEAANKGASDAGTRSIGFNITLPSEQQPNAYSTPSLSFQFRYFAIRKMHFLLRARALVAFPGGYGTMDELFEVLTLIETQKIARIPVILIGSDFWRRAIDFQFLVDEGVLEQSRIDLFSVVDTAEQAVDIIADFYTHPAAG